MCHLPSATLHEQHTHTQRHIHTHTHTQVAPPPAWVSAFYDATFRLLPTMSSQDLANIAWSVAQWEKLTQQQASQQQGESLTPTQQALQQQDDSITPSSSSFNSGNLSSGSSVGDSLTSSSSNGSDVNSEKSSSSSSLDRGSGDSVSSVSSEKSSSNSSDSSKVSRREQHSTPSLSLPPPQQWLTRLAGQLGARLDREHSNQPLSALRGDTFKTAASPLNTTLFAANASPHTTQSAAVSPPALTGHHLGVLVWSLQVRVRQCL